MPVSTREEEQDEGQQNQSSNRSQHQTEIETEDGEPDNVDDTATLILPSTPGTGTLDTLVPVSKPKLSTKQKLKIAKPLLWSFMIPLFIVYFAEVSYVESRGKKRAFRYNSP